MTRAASGAKRSGAAVHDLPRLRVIMPSLHLYFPFSFFVPRTPARLERRRIRLRSGGAIIAGSTVLHGTGGRTANRLKSIGSTVLFYSPSRDARTDMRGYTRIETIQNHRTTEPQVIILYNHHLSGSVAVLFFSGRLTDTVKNQSLSGSAHAAARLTNKKWGGYSPRAFAGSSRPDQGPDAGAAGENFSAWARPAAVATGSIGAIGVAVRNGGFPPFFGVPIGHVGTAMSEWLAGMADFRRFRDIRIQPARLAALAQAAPGGRAGRRGVPPPSAAPQVPCSLAQPVFQVSSDLRIRCSMSAVAGRRLRGWAKAGSGVRSLSLRDHGRGAKAASGELIGRVGDMGAFRTWGREPERATLWGGLAHVN